MTADTFTEIHHATNPAHSRVTFEMHGYDEGKPTEFGVLIVEIRTSDGNGHSHYTTTKHFMRGADWQGRAAVIRQSFHSATLKP